MPPYSKKYMKKKGFTKYQPFRSHAPRAGRYMGSKDRQLFQRAPHKAELKCVDQNLGLAFDTATDLTVLNGIAVGSNEYQRVGRRIEMQYCLVRGIIQPASNQTINQPDYYRMVLVYDRQTNGSAPAFSDIFTDTDNTGTTTSFAFSHANKDNKYRFIILRDQSWYVPPVSALNWQNNSGTPQLNGGSFNGQPLKVNWYVPLKGLITQYIGDGHTTASISTGSLYMFVIAATASSADVQFQGAARLAYYDA